MLRRDREWMWSALGLTSAILLQRAGAADFPALWEKMCHESFAMNESYLGLAGNPVEWTDRYVLSDDEAGPRRWADGAKGVPDARRVGRVDGESHYQRYGIWGTGAVG